ncbi:hypothetical protein [Candidatus Ferrigenium straubiae]|jgi:hypothetical protein|uniref:hypothetical protein n=1 Tax=Candidatus Ferrigenium straubiae TaxID=2919506 RepID=UPI003F4AF0A2
MKKIATIALLYAIAAMPVYAAEDYLVPEADAPDVLRSATLGKIRASADRLSTFNLLEVNNNFSLYGKLSIPRLTTGIETGIQRNAVTYGLHGQLGSMAGIGIPKMGLRFGWNRDLVGPDSGGNMYSLTAEIKF